MLAISKENKDKENPSSEIRTLQVSSENNDPAILMKKDGPKPISMASFNWLEKSDDIIMRATGKPSTSFYKSFQTMNCAIHYQDMTYKNNITSELILKLHLQQNV